MTSLRKLDQSFFTPLLKSSIHRLGNAVSKQHQKVPWFMAKNIALIAIRQKPNHRTAGLEAEYAEGFSTTS